LPEELVARKPNNISFEEAAAIPLAALTAYRATIAVSSVKKEEVVFIAGLGGGVGSFALQFARFSGTQMIYTIAKDEESSLFLQKKMGIERDHIVIYEELNLGQLKEKLLTRNDGRFFNTTLDFVGGEMKRLCLELTGYSGHFVSILPEDEKFNFPIWTYGAIPFARNLSIHQISLGAELRDNNREYWKIYAHHLEHIAQMLENGTINPPSIQIMGSLSANTVQKAHALLEQRRIKGKLVMIME
jgi:NADPH:quinone reductase-like Zn-dependent oxidoreductase